jgi:hypothetical protein
MVQSFQSAEPKELFAGYRARYLSTGHIVIGMPGDNNLYAIAFDLDRLAVVGGAVLIVQNVSQAAVSDAGTLAYMPGVAADDLSGRTLVWVDREGKEEPLHLPPNEYHVPKISPDGTRVALAAISDGNLDIWIWNLVSETRMRLTFWKGNDYHPNWTPDGKRIVFASDREGYRSIYWKAADGTGVEEKLGSMPERVLRQRWLRWFGQLPKGIKCNPA